MCAKQQPEQVADGARGRRDLCYQNLAPTEVLLSHSQPRQKFNSFRRALFVSSLALPPLRRDTAPAPARCNPIIKEGTVQAGWHPPCVLGNFVPAAAAIPSSANHGRQK